ncbi:integrase_H2C2 domain-containing protein [Nephila pilipes]|uniref:Integrase_H2C2 domain-containing protein n=1 Tax=Nephila pilipes TaxID=299642 RepID=A0A8X6UCG6_NEPPI|nr:integrase_H2C2 domain-containing protein [Nephila pilipes]GFT34058.1 integrase_H2C2 domain-containing protein [Nephila pilipes]GFT83554.1 integrase_H2C2 domain-containing protein [Nephila pilipes]GFT99170.1 integrase_H2C2 domain-containing protein [Nephila pilipes]GFU17031.1 integrase_H2C2 domain-containing protein [Nephila pilipes]
MQAFKDEGLLRVSTKLIYSDENEDFRFPVLLPTCSIVKELIHEEHRKAMHAGPSILLSILREKFWILKAKRLIILIIAECVACRCYKSKNVDVPFTPLPQDRVTQTKVFQVTGVDYAGSLHLKSKRKV